MLLRILNGASFSLVTVIGLLLSLTVPAIVNAEERSCPEEASVDLINATRNASGYLADSGLFFPTEIVRNEEGALRGCMCDVKPCVSLCPPLRNEFGKTVLAGEFSINLTEISMFRTTSLISEDAENLSPNAEEWFHFVTWDACMDGHYYELYQNDYETGKWHLFENGSLFIPSQNDTKILLDWRQYCLWKELNYTSYVPLICFYLSSDPLAMLLCICAVMSVPFLIATIFVYSVLPQLQNIHGKTLSSYLGCLLVMNICRVIHWMYPPISRVKVFCLIFEFIMYFAFLASFLWLNVMCFDMWLRFGGYGSKRIRGRIDDRTKVIGFSIYAWGIPVLMGAICFGLGFLPIMPEAETTNVFREQSCWSSRSTWDEVLISGAPVFMSIICNTGFFASTLIKLVQQQRTLRHQLTSGDSKKHDHNQPQLTSVYAKLFVIMGIIWSMFLTWMCFNPPVYIRYFGTLLDELQGIPIFMVLVCKKKIWQSLKIRFKL